MLITQAYQQFILKKFFHLIIQQLIFSNAVQLLNLKGLSLSKQSESSLAEDIYFNLLRSGQICFTCVSFLIDLQLELLMQEPLLSIVIKQPAYIKQIIKYLGNPLHLHVSCDHSPQPSHSNDIPKNPPHSALTLFGTELHNEPLENIKNPETNCEPALNSV